MHRHLRLVVATHLAVANEINQGMEGGVNANTVPNEPLVLTGRSGEAVPLKQAYIDSVNYPGVVHGKPQQSVTPNQMFGVV